MAENLDDLLDEVETKFCRSISWSASLKANQGSQQKSDNAMTRTSNRKHSDGTDNDIDAALQEILDDEWRTIGSHTTTATHTRPKESSQRTLKKCCPVFVGGSAIISGIGTSISKRACDKLRCTSCDFHVVMFDDREWDVSCDYLFFRNNMPDCTKLRAKLKRRQGARAYACQCSWHSVLALSELRHLQQLKWVCGQHKDC